ncbi:MAG: hypothetical protein K2O12_02560, partial [Muribaculaceae bacterium]|nr:hypothetical protein [Muribaculaceae bacterium]
TVEYNVTDISKVNFETRVIPFSVTPAGEETIKYKSIPTVFRQNPAETGDPTLFGFGNGDGSLPEETIQNSDYGIVLAVSAVKLYNGEFDLASNPDSYSLHLAKYEDGNLVYDYSEVTSGTLSTSINNKNRKVTITLDATFKDGTNVTVNYEGVPVNVESLDALLPEMTLGNEFYYYDASGNESHYEISGASMRASSSYDTYTFSLSGGYSDLQIILRDRELVNSGTLNLAEAVGFEIRYNNVQLGRRTADDVYSNCPNNGTMTFNKKDDGTYEISVDVTNKYNNFMGDNLGNGERIYFHYAGEIN